MTDASVSLIIVSRHRTASLLRTISAVRLQDYTMLELIVVADPDAVVAVRALGLPIKVVAFDEANIAAARNAGLVVAAGDIVAFLDDDAVPEPSWISRLAVPFANSNVRMATGFVRGRNGISDQWRACDVDQFGWDHPLAVDRIAVTLLAGTPLRGWSANVCSIASRSFPVSNAAVRIAWFACHRSRHFWIELRSIRSVLDWAVILNPDAAPNMIWLRVTNPARLLVSRVICSKILPSASLTATSFALLNLSSFFLSPLYAFPFCLLSSAHVY